MGFDKVGLSKLGLNGLIFLLVIFSTSFNANLPILSNTSKVLAQTVDARKTEADSLFNKGFDHYEIGQIDLALKLWQQALQIYRDIQDRKAEVILLRNIGRIYHDWNDYPQAVEYYQKSLVIAREIKNQKGELTALGDLGSAYFSLANYPKAIESQQQSLAIAREIEDSIGIVNALINLGSNYGATGNYPQALEYYQQALIPLRELKDREKEAQLLGNIGLIYDGLGDYPKSIKNFQDSLAIAREVKSRKSEGYVLGNLGITYRKLGNYPKAIEVCEQSLAIARETKDRFIENSSLGNLGTIYNILGNYPKAIEYYQQSLVIARQIKDRRSEVATLAGLGNVYSYLGNYTKALEYHQQSLVGAREINDRQSEGSQFLNIGIAYKDLGNYQKAIEYQEQSLKIAREIKNRAGEGSSLSNLGTAYSYLGNDPKAMEFFQQSFAIAREIKNRHSEGVALHNMGGIYYTQGKLALAESNLIESIKVWESLRERELKDTEKILIFEQQAATYRTLQQVLIAQNKTDAALEISERGRARAFVELLTSRISTNPNSQLLTPPAIAEIKQTAKSQKTTLIQYSIIYDEFKFQDKQGWKESELYIWVIKPTGEITFRKSDLKPLWQKENTNLDSLVTTTRDSIGARGTSFRGIEVSYNPDAPKAKNKLKRLHELLINPIADLLPKNPNARITFIPQSSLFLVPFPALQDKEGKYLIEKHTILTSPSIQVLDLTRKQKQRIGNKSIQPNNLLIVGNPTMPAVSPKIGEAPQQLSALPGTEREANAIASLFKTQSLIGSQATETEVTKRLSQAKFIHLATHGLFDNIQGLNSSIALAPGNKGNKDSDGLLTAGEILDLKLNAELVVLSACDTGRGKISGDGVIGLSRSLISAGVPSVLVSLWAVPDAPTAELMTEFYQNLQKNPDKAQALRQAMLKTMKQHPNPSAWAAFTLIGEAE
jgi:CHAT domain-containing protein